MSKKCLYCGAELEDDDRFCGECGKQQEAAADGRPAGGEVKVESVGSKEKTKRIIKIVIGIAVVIVLLSMCGGCAAASDRGEAQTMSETAEEPEAL